MLTKNFIDFWQLSLLFGFYGHLATIWPSGRRSLFWPSWPSDGALVPRGGALAFWHGEHPLSLLHEGSPVTRGVKTIVRSDVLYLVPGAICPA